MSTSGRQYAFAQPLESCHWEFQHRHGGTFIELMLTTLNGQLPHHKAAIRLLGELPARRPISNPHFVPG
jgi:hypothetical protein